MTRFQRFHDACARDPGRWPGLLHFAPLALKVYVTSEEEHQYLARMINSFHPGKATFVTHMQMWLDGVLKKGRNGQDDFGDSPWIGEKIKAAAND
jgi:hypothetical protein